MCFCEVVFGNIIKFLLQRFGARGGCNHQCFCSTGGATNRTPCPSSSSKSDTFCGVVCLARQAVLAFAALSSNTNLQSFYHVDFRRCSHDLATLCLKSNSPRENQSSARKCASADTDEVASRGFGSAGVVPRMSPLSKPVARVVHASLLRQSLGDINSSLRSLILRIVESLFGIFIFFGVM